MCELEGESIFHLLFACDPARQVWALAGIAQPEWTFSEGSMFSNINYLCSSPLRNDEEAENRRSWPWILWTLWKCRNELIFKGVRWESEEIHRKAKEEADEWFLAQLVEEKVIQVKAVKEEKGKRKWKPPEQDWLICNVVFELDKKTKLLGVAWVVRNHRGVVVIHSRRAFSNISSLEEARFTTLSWAVESMTSLHYNKAIIAGDFKELMLALRKPHLWPVLDFQVGEVSKLLEGIGEVKLRWAGREENRGVTFIAQSVTRQKRLNSYVASGH